MLHELDSNIKQKILECIFSGNKTNAVKIYKDYSGKGLKESKQHVEFLINELKRSNPEKFTEPHHISKKASRDRYAIPLIALLMLASALAVFVSERFFAPFAWVLLMFLGVDVFLVSTESIRKVFSAKKWPVAHGSLLTANAIQEKHDENWSLELEYKYFVNGQLFQGRNYNWVGVVAFSKKGIEKIIDDINANKDDLHVYYNPGNYGESVLHSTLSVLHVIGIFIGPCIFGVAAFGLFGKFT